MKHVRDLTSGTGLSALISFLKEEKYSFVTPTPATHSRNNQRAGNERALSLTDAFGWSRPFSPSLLPSPLFDLLRDSAVIFECVAEWKSSVRASTLDGELFLHSAFPTVSPDAVFLGPTRIDLPGRSKIICCQNRVSCAEHWIWDVDRAREA